MRSPSQLPGYRAIFDRSWPVLNRDGIGDFPQVCWRFRLACFERRMARWFGDRPAAPSSKRLWPEYIGCDRWFRGTRVRVLCKGIVSATTRRFAGETTAAVAWSRPLSLRSDAEPAYTVWADDAIPGSLICRCGSIASIPLIAMDFTADRGGRALQATSNAAHGLMAGYHHGRSLRVPTGSGRLVSAFS